MVGPPVFPENSLYQNGWSFSISGKAGYIKMVGPSIFPDTRVLPKWLVFQYSQIHGFLKWVDWQHFGHIENKGNVDILVLRGLWRFKKREDYDPLLSFLETPPVSKDVETHGIYIYIYIYIDR